MYTWGYIKDVTLSKLDLDEYEAEQQNLLRRFKFYANEAITQICSTVKPKRTFVNFNVEYKTDVWRNLCKYYKVYSCETIINKPSKLTEQEKLFWDDFESRYFVGDLIKMPDDFISFGDDVNTCQRMINNKAKLLNCTDNDFTYKGYNNIIFWQEGIYGISYNARWITFDDSYDNNKVLDVPKDILECLPSYIASQCYKIDDENKSAIFRNEYEMFLARIDNTDFRSNKNFNIDGDW